MIAVGSKGALWLQDTFIKRRSASAEEIKEIDWGQATSEIHNKLLSTKPVLLDYDFEWKAKFL